MDPAWTIPLERKMKTFQHTWLFLRARVKMEDYTDVQMLGKEPRKYGTFCRGMLHSHYNPAFEERITQKHVFYTISADDK